MGSLGGNERAGSIIFKPKEKSSVSGGFSL